MVSDHESQHHMEQQVMVDLLIRERYQHAGAIHQPVADGFPWSQPSLPAPLIDDHDLEHLILEHLTRA
jgi:hypothetical protein